MINNPDLWNSQDQVLYGGPCKQGNPVMLIGLAGPGKIPHSKYPFNSCYLAKFLQVPYKEIPAWYSTIGPSAS